MWCRPLNWRRYRPCGQQAQLRSGSRAPDPTVGACTGLDVDLVCCCWPPARPAVKVVQVQASGRSFDLDYGHQLQQSGLAQGLMLTWCAVAGHQHARRLRWCCVNLKQKPPQGWLLCLQANQSKLYPMDRAVGNGRTVRSGRSSMTKSKRIPGITRRAMVSASSCLLRSVVASSGP